MSPKQILFVDDDEAFLDLIRYVMKQHAGEGWDILTASNASKGLAILQQQHVDLLVIDLHMPVVDGLQFLSLLQRRFPNVLKAVLTGDTSGQQRAAALSNGAELFFAKPTDREGWREVYEALNELSRLQPEQGFRGVLRQVGLADVLQLSCLARHSVVLRVRAPNLEGVIYVKDGEVLYAQCDQRTGEAAFNFLLGLSGGQFELQPFVMPPEQNIHESWESLLMEAARKTDESANTPRSTSNTDVLFSKLDAMEGGDSSLTAAAAPDEPEIYVPPEDPVVPEVLHPQIDEILICSLDGEVLHEWQCPGKESRLSFLEFVSQKARLLGQSLPLGEFDRIEVNGERARIIAQFQPERALVVRSSRVPVETTSTSTAA